MVIDVEFWASGEDKDIKIYDYNEKKANGDPTEHKRKLRNGMPELVQLKSGFGSNKGSITVKAALAGTTAWGPKKPKNPDNLEVIEIGDSYLPATKPQTTAS